MKKSNAFVKRLMAATMAAALCATMAELPVAAQAGQNEKGVESNAGNDSSEGTVSDADTESKDAFDIQNISGLYNEQKNPAVAFLLALESGLLSSYCLQLFPKHFAPPG